MPFPRWCVALPARNEARRLPGALEALDAAARPCAGPVRVLVFADRCEDDTGEIARSLATRLRHIKISVAETSDFASVGAARREACEHALSQVGDGPGSLLLTTDADARLYEDALSRMEGAFAGGADLVAARLDPARDPFDSATRRAMERARADARRRGLIRRLAARRDTGLDSPAQHDDYGGAGLAFTAAAYRRLGGFDPVSHDEDRRLARSAERAGLAVNRTSRARVLVLARRTGRAPQGMADALIRAEDGAPALVERADLTLARLDAGQSALDVIEARPLRTEPVEAALAGLRQALSGPARVKSAA